MNRGNTQLAARCAFWIGFTLLLSGESSKVGGWLSRASRLLEGEPDCVEKGYLLLPTGYRAVRSGDTATTQVAFEQASAVGERFGDKDLVPAPLVESIERDRARQCLRMGAGPFQRQVLDLQR